MSMDCKTFESLLADAIGGELGDADLRAFETHADACDHCRIEFRSLVSTMEQVRDRFGPIDAQSKRRVGDAGSRDRFPSGWVKLGYAAVIALAFVTGYGLRGAGAGKSADVSEAPSGELRAITVHDQLAVAHRRMPEASMFAKSMLAVLGPRAQDSHP